MYFKINDTIPLVVRPEAIGPALSLTGTINLGATDRYWANTYTYNLNLNRSKGAGYGRVYFYSPTYTTWVDYVSNIVAGAAPTGGTPSTLGDVTTWARRSIIENNSGYGWIWESCKNGAAANTSVTPTPIMSLGSNTATLEVAGLIKSTKNGNTVTIGSQNATFTHIYNSANIPFIFNKDVYIASNYNLLPYNTPGSIGLTDKRWNSSFFTTAVRVGAVSTNTSSTTDRNIYIGPDGVFLDSITADDCHIVLRGVGANYAILRATTIGVANTTGSSELILGNATAYTAAKNAKGAVSLYSSGTKGTSIVAANNSTAWYTATLQAKTGTIALTSDITDLDFTSIGVAAATGNKFVSQISQTDGKISAAISTATIGTQYIPVYINQGTITQITANSVLANLSSTTAASTYAASPRPGITGTLGTAHGGTGNTSFTQWGVVYANPATKLVSTGQGTSGYVLTAKGAAAPAWTAQSALSGVAAAKNTSLSFGTTSTIATIGGNDINVTMPSSNFTHHYGSSAASTTYWITTNIVASDAGTTWIRGQVFGSKGTTLPAFVVFTANFYKINGSNPLDGNTSVTLNYWDPLGLYSSFQAAFDSNRKVYFSFKYNSRYSRVEALINHDTITKNEIASISTTAPTVQATYAGTKVTS